MVDLMAEKMVDRLELMRAVKLAEKMAALWVGWLDQWRVVWMVE